MSALPRTIGVEVVDTRTEEGRKRVAMHDASRPFAVLCTEHAGYKAGGRLHTYVVDRWPTRKQATAARRRSEAR